MMYPRPLSILCCSLLLLSGCGDDGADENNEQPPQVDCPRLELESLTDCTFDEQLDYNMPETVDRYCASSCQRVLSIYARGPGDGFLASRDLSLLARVDEVPSAVSVFNMEYLKNVNGLDSVRHIGGGLRIQLNPELQNLEGLSSLESVAMGDSPQTDMYLYGNRKLETLDGLEALKEVGMALIIDDHANLQSIEALESLETVPYLSITDNPKLPTCQAEALAERLDLPDDKVEIRGNGTGSCE
jgi:hypothetical protein